MEHQDPGSQSGGVAPTGERRRYRRVEVAWDVTVESGPRIRHQGEMVSFGPFGMKVRLGEDTPGPPEGSIVRLEFTPRPEGQVISVRGVVCRVDADGLAITLINLSHQEFDRLKSLVDALLDEGRG